VVPANTFDEILIQSLSVIMVPNFLFTVSFGRFRSKKCGFGCSERPIPVSKGNKLQISPVAVTEINTMN